MEAFTILVDSETLTSYVGIAVNYVKKIIKYLKYNAPSG
jgi:hypothetical protein